MTSLTSAPPDTQPPYDTLPSTSVDDDTLAILRLIEGDPIHAHDRSLVVQAIVDEAADAGGMVDPNKVRDRLNHAVLPQVVGPVYSCLSRAGVLEVAGWTTNLDKAGRNAGKPCRTYRLIGATE